MAAAEYAGKTPAKIKDMDMENLGKAQKEQQSLEQQLHDMRQLLKWKEIADGVVSNVLLITFTDNE